MGCSSVHSLVYSESVRSCVFVLVGFQLLFQPLGLSSCLWGANETVLWYPSAPLMARRVNRSSLSLFSLFILQTFDLKLAESLLMQEAAAPDRTDGLFLQVEKENMCTRGASILRWTDWPHLFSFCLPTGDQRDRSPSRCPPGGEKLSVDGGFSLSEQVRQVLLVAFVGVLGTCTNAAGLPTWS